MIALRAVFLALACAAPLVQAASFNCSKAKTQMEKLICSDPALSAVDEQLGRSYARALDRVGDRKMVRRWQLDWLRSHDLVTCGDAACLIPMFQSRVAVLDGVVASPWNGRYQRLHGKRLDTDSADVTVMGLRDGRAVVLGTALWVGANGAQGGVNTGEINGIAAARGDTLVYQDEECKVTFVRSKNGLELTDSGHCGGHNVTFSGRYMRSAVR